MTRTISTLLLLTGCTFEAPEMDAASFGVCLWAPVANREVLESEGCWLHHAPAGGKLTSFELADPCDAPDVGVDTLLQESGADVYAYYYTGPPFERNRFTFDRVECPQ
jgi:hypothetical protein